MKLRESGEEGGTLAATGKSDVNPDLVPSL